MRKWLEEEGAVRPDILIQEYYDVDINYYAGYLHHKDGL